MSELKYKVGDCVRIKSIDWYNENKDRFGQIDTGYAIFSPEMAEHCGRIVTISFVYKNYYDIMEDSEHWYWTDEMIEGLVEEDIIDIDEFQDDNEIIDIIDEYVHRLKGNECQINLPEGYIFKDENGNVINAKKIVLEKKKNDMG